MDFAALTKNSYTFSTETTLLLITVLVWSYVWKGLALWRAGRRGDKVWFIVLLILNTAGILEILYIFYFSRKTDRAKTE